MSLRGSVSLFIISLLILYSGDTLTFFSRVLNIQSFLAVFIFSRPSIFVVY